MLVIFSVQHYHYCCVFLQTNNTALHFAAFEGSNKVITFLLDNGAGINDVDDVSYYYILVCIVLIITLTTVFQYLSYLVK